VLHDDAFIINTGEVAYSVALEPTYYDKTQDYPADHPDNKYLLTAQNVGVTLDKNGKKVIVPEDIRNGNGRAIKSRFWSPNRIDFINEPVNAIFWLMKDPTLPPALKLNNSVVASVMGATLATKRTTAERLAEGVDPNALVVEPYANPFRTYALGNDFVSFKKLFEENKVDCYILNTGDMMGKKIPKEVTLGILESIIEDKATFKPFGKIESFEYMPVEGFIPDFNDAKYTEQLANRMLDRVAFIEDCSKAMGGFNKLPDEALTAMKEVAAQAAK
jgi:phosphoenolpyruvate carboxykinase (ATP)